MGAKDGKAGDVARLYKECSAETVNPDSAGTVIPLSSDQRHCGFPSYDNRSTAGCRLSHSTRPCPFNTEADARLTAPELKAQRMTADSSALSFE